MSLNNNVLIDFEEPIVQYNDSSIHLYKKVDTLWIKEPFIFRQRQDELLGYELLGEWRPEIEYKLAFDSAAFVGLYGLHTKLQETKLKFKPLNQ